MENVAGSNTDILSETALISLEPNSFLLIECLHSCKHMIMKMKHDGKSALASLVNMSVSPMLVNQTMNPKQLPSIGELEKLDSKLYFQVIDFIESQNTTEKDSLFYYRANYWALEEKKINSTANHETWCKAGYDRAVLEEQAAEEISTEILRYLSQAPSVQPVYS